MNIKLFPNKGCAILASGNSNGYWKIQGLSHAAPILVQAVKKDGKDTVGTTVCFNNKRVAAIISKDFGSVAIECIALIGEVTEQKAFENYLQSFIAQNRSSSSAKVLKISSKTGGASRFLLTAYSILGPDPEYNIFKFTLGGILLD